MDDGDVRYIVREACRNVRDELWNEIDRLNGEVATLYCRVKELEGGDKVEPNNSPTPLGQLINSATEFAKTCHEDRPAGHLSVRQALTCFLEHCLKEEPEENEEDIERIEDMLEQPDPDQYPHDEHVGLDLPEGYGS